MAGSPGTGAVMGDITTAPMIVGMVDINCPACGELIHTDVRVLSVSTKNGSYLEIEYQKESPTHRCVGRRT